MNPYFSSFKDQMKNPIKNKLYFLMKLPMAFLAGLRITEFTEKKCVVQVQYKWLNTNPFKSMYFAVLSMAAELSTGSLCMGNIYKRNPAVSMLVVKSEGNYFKKAVGKISFSCTMGTEISQAVEQAIATSTAQTIRVQTIGKNDQGEVVAESFFTWSFKRKN